MASVGVAVMTSGWDWVISTVAAIGQARCWSWAARRATSTVGIDVICHQPVMMTGELFLMQQSAKLSGSASLLIDGVCFKAWTPQKSEGKCNEDLLIWVLATLKKNYE